MREHYPEMAIILLLIVVFVGLAILVINPNTKEFNRVTRADIEYRQCVALQTNAGFCYKLAREILVPGYPMENKNSNATGSVSTK